MLEIVWRGLGQSRHVLEQSAKNTVELIPVRVSMTAPERLSVHTEVRRLAQCKARRRTEVDAKPAELIVEYLIRAA